MGAWMLVAALFQVTPGAVVTVARGSHSQIDDARQVIVRDPVEWAALWKAHGAVEPPPSVDFSAEMVAAVFLGSRPTGGYRVEVVGYQTDGASLVVDVEERAPGPDALVTQALTSPFHIVKVPRHEGPVRFEKVPAPPVPTARSIR